MDGVARQRCGGKGQRHPFTHLKRLNKSVGVPTRSFYRTDLHLRVDSNGTPPACRIQRISTCDFNGSLPACRLQRISTCVSTRRYLRPAMATQSSACRPQKQCSRGAYGVRGSARAGQKKNKSDASERSSRGHRRQGRAVGQHFVFARPSQVNSRFLFMEARKPYAEAAGHGRRGWCAWVWSPPPPRSLKRARREMSHLSVVFCRPGNFLFGFSLRCVGFSRSSVLKFPFKGSW